MSKPKYVQVVDPKELAHLILHSGELNYPLLVVIQKAMWADADELRLWRASQTTSDGEQR